jgi:hypothetical protein
MCWGQPALVAQMYFEVVDTCSSTVTHILVSALRNSAASVGSAVSRAAGDTAARRLWLVHVLRCTHVAMLCIYIYV